MPRRHPLHPPPRRPLGGVAAFLLTLSLTLPASAPAAEQAVRLRLGPIEEPTDLWIRTEVEEQVRTAQGETLKSRSDTLELAERFVYQAPGGHLLVIVDVLGREDVLADVALDEDLDAYEYHLTPQGLRVNPDEGDDLELGFLPTLPEGPILPGHRWKTRVGPEQGLPVPVDFEHVFLGLDEVQGTQCALIESQAEAKGETPAEGIRFRAHIYQGVALGLADGQLVKMATLLRMKSVGAEGKTARQVYRILQRREEGDAEVPPGGYEGSDLAEDAGGLEAMEGP